MMDELDAQVDLAENFLRAGNLKRAEEICQDVLQKRHDDLGAFDCLFDIHLKRNQLKEAYDLCDWRLARRPECPSTHINKLVAYGRLSAMDLDYDHARKIKGEAFMANIRPRLANHPSYLAQAEILHRLYFCDSKDALKRVEQERQKGQLPTEWLDEIETILGVHTGDTARSRELLLKRLAENPQDFNALIDLSAVDYFRGRLFSAIKYARQARRAAPQQAALPREIILAATIGLIPIFWIGQIIITITVFLSQRLEDHVAMTVRYGGLLLTFCAYGYIFSRLIELGYGSNNLMLFAVILLGGWAYYVLFSFLDIGLFFSNREKSIKISKKY